MVLHLLQWIPRVCLCKIFWLCAASWKTITVTAEKSPIVSGHKNTKKLHNIFQKSVTGYISPKPTVVIVTKPHHIAIGIDVKSVPATHLSAKYTATDPINKIMENRSMTAAYSSLYSQIALINQRVRGIFFNNLTTLKTLNTLRTFQNSHTTNNQRKKGRKESKSIILHREKIKEILWSALKNLYKYSQAKIIEINASNTNNCWAYIASLLPKLSKISTAIKTKIKNVIKLWIKFHNLLSGSSRMLFGFLGFSARIRSFNFLITF